MKHKRSAMHRRRHTRNVSSEMVPLSARAVTRDSPVIANLVAGVAHEVNNPAAYVGANLAVLAEHVQSVEEAVHDIEALLADDPIRTEQLRRLLETRELARTLDDARSIVDDNLKGVHRLSGFVRALQGFTCIDEMDLEAVDLNEIVKASCRSLAGSAPTPSCVIQELSDLPALVGDRARLLQAITELLENALDALDTPQADEPVVLVRTQSTEAHIIVSVLDTGEGIRESVKDRIFEPFYSARSGHRGLGLCMVASAAREHGGDVRVYSRLGEGARFDLVLPLETGLQVPRAAAT